MEFFWCVFKFRIYLLVGILIIIDEILIEKMKKNIQK